MDIDLDITLRLVAAVVFGVTQSDAAVTR